LAPTFIIPDDFKPQIAIEARVTEGDGMSGDTVNRAQHPATLAMRGQSPVQPKFQVVARIAERSRPGFGSLKNGTASP